MMAALAGHPNVLVYDAAFQDGWPWIPTEYCNLRSMFRATLLPRGSTTGQ